MKPAGVTEEEFMGLCRPSHSDCLALLRAKSGATVKDAEAALDLYFDRGAGTRQFKRL